MIELKNIDVTFKNGSHEFKAVDNVSLKINKGEIFGIVGPSGAGKSTLVRVINLLQRPTNGEVIIEGSDITKFNRKQLRKTRLNIGMIFQHFNLISGSTIAENIAFSLYANDYPKNKIKDRVKELLEIVHLPEKADAYPANLSGGQKQRVAIARALANNPDILLCDEATSALDPKTTKDILALLEDINKKLGITIVIVTHQMEVVKQICQKVALLQGGVLVAEGKAEEVFLKPEVSLKKFLGEEEDDDALPKNGVNIKLFFPSDSSENALITKMARELNIDFSIVGGKLEKFRNNVLGTLTININEKDREEVMKYLSSKDIILEVL